MGPVDAIIGTICLLLKTSIALSNSSFITLAYTSVCFTEACPKILETYSIRIPFCKARTAQLCLAV